MRSAYLTGGESGGRNAVYFQIENEKPQTMQIVNVGDSLSYTEIAESASIELGTVKSRISRGRSLLRNFLSENGNFFEIASSKVTECNREEMSAK